MCCFSGAVQWVGETRVFARPTRADRQLVVYGMRFESARDVAMILPLPVARGAGEDALRFIDLSPWPGFFADLERAFPRPVPRGASLSRMAPQSAPRQTLAVHDVGAFVASYVPTLADFDRLDPRFRMPPSVWSALPGYAQHGFAVFQLRATATRSIWPWARKTARRAVHPMAFEFPRADPSVLFFPTVHVHDGTVHAEADFDHSLYAQGADLALDWERSSGPLGAVVKPLVPDLLDLAAHGYKRDVVGRHPNRDLTVPAARA